jgi:MFS family permease
MKRPLRDKPIASGSGRLSRTVRVLGLVSLFTDVASEMIYPLLPVFMANVLGAGAISIGLVEGIAEGTASVLKGFAGYISDRLGRRKALLLAGYGLSAFAKPFFAAADAVWQVLLVRFADRVGKGIRTAPRDALITEETDPSLRGRAFGFHRALDTLGAVIGPGLAFLMMWLLRDSGSKAYRVVFLAAFIPGLISILLIALFLKERRDGKRAVLPGMSLKGFSKSYLVLLAVVAVFTLGNSSDAFLLLRAQALGMKTYLVPLFWMLFNIVYSAVSMPGGMLSDRIGRKKTLLIGFVIYAVVYVGFAFARQTAQLWLLIGAYGLFYGLTHGVLNAYVADLAPSELKGTAFGVFHMTDGIGKVLASVIFGVLWQVANPAVAFVFGASMALVAALLMWAFCEECQT